MATLPSKRNITGVRLLDDPVNSLTYLLTNVVVNCCVGVKQSAGKRVRSRLLRTSLLRSRLLFRARGSNRRAGRSTDARRRRADELRTVVSARPLRSPRRDRLDRSEDSLPAS